MTTWLDFRTEPIMFDVPEVEVIHPGNGEQPYVECQGLDCNFIEGVTNRYEADDVITRHQKWHEEGMPQ